METYCEIVVKKVLFSNSYPPTLPGMAATNWHLGKCVHLWDMWTVLALIFTRLLLTTCMDFSTHNSGNSSAATTL